MIKHVLARTLTALAIVAGSAAGAAAADIDIELNKLEPQENGCLAYMVLKNGLEQPVTGLRLETYLFDADGIIVQPLTVDVAPIRASSTVIKRFVIPAVQCTAIGRVHLNDVTQCQIGGKDADGCIARIATTSRAGIDFTR
ncbi:hypothetical protein [Futiania mangrovi]|uniref:Tat pathway signal sequence domain protein n=1 Tax=Futiania mangrovi TaxID=2959716 RepID=A0A9J6PFI6_9PROT|nr:hypothetical protein [Futiania mangrovii]MCP1335383.1 hypothetical protein [Futiania mangrovii]